MLAITGFTQSGVLLTFIMMSLYAALLSQAWNILGGYGGQLSFGHALFFGVGAYAQALGQLSLGWNPWLALPCAIALGMAAGLAVGGLTFRYGLRGSTSRWSRWPSPRCCASWRPACPSPAAAWA